MLPAELAYVALGGSIIACAFYLRDMFRGKAKPNKVSWFIWGLAPLIGGFIEIQNGAGIRALPTLVSGISPMIIFTASFFLKESYWKLEKLDIFCGLLSIAALYVWLALGQGALAVVFAVAADLLAGIPTIIKSWKYPETENKTAYGIYTVNSLIGMFIARSFSISAMLFPVYFFLLNGGIFLILSRKPHKFA